MDGLEALHAVKKSTNPAARIADDIFIRSIFPPLPGGEQMPIQGFREAVHVRRVPAQHNVGGCRMPALVFFGGIRLQPVLAHALLREDRILRTRLLFIGVLGDRTLS